MDFILRIRWDRTFYWTITRWPRSWRAPGVKAGDHILEIGPGAGLLTAMMADAGADVLAVELDRAVEPVLRDVLGERSVRIVFADCMKADLKALTVEAFGENAPFSIVANLPYYITADFLMRAVRLSPERITVMVQKEAAERCCRSQATRTGARRQRRCAILPSRPW